MSTPARAACWIIIFAMVLTGSNIASGFGEAPAPTGKTTLPRHQLLQQFDALPAAARLKLVEKDLAVKTDFQPIARTVLTAGVVARGSLISANNQVVFCTVRASTKGGVATTIKWLIDNGASVKKGELLVQLDDSAIPVRRFRHGSRCLTRMHTSMVVGATPELAGLMPLPLETGRFLMQQDMEERRSVAVLGAGVADALSPDEDAVGRSIVLNREHYVVVGVLAADDANTTERAGSIYLPLSTCQSRFGAKIIIRSGGTRHAEAVELSDIYVTMRSPLDVVSTLEAIRDLLAERHEKKDWAVRVDD
jgi:hypothetical protein